MLCLVIKHYAHETFKDCSGRSYVAVNLTHSYQKSVHELSSTR